MVVVIFSLLDIIILSIKDISILNSANFIRSTFLKKSEISFKNIGILKLT